LSIRPATLVASFLCLVPPAEAFAQFECRPLSYRSLADTSIAGTVVDKESGRPVPSIHIELDGGPLGATDCNGGFALPYNVRDGKHVVSTWSPYFKRASTKVTVAGPAITWVALKVELHPPARRPPLDLAGDWHLLFYCSALRRCRVCLAPWGGPHRHSLARLPSYRLFEGIP
jgi:hypothetical protein